MNKLGYKQKGIPMLNSPLNIEGVTGVTGVTGANERENIVRKENSEHSARAKTIRQAPGKLFNAITGGFFTDAAVKKRGAKLRANTPEGIKGPRIKNSSNPTATEMAPKQDYRGPTQAEGKKLTQALEPTKTGTAGGGGKNTRGKVKSVNPGIKTQKINVLDSGAARTSQIPTAGKAERKDILDSKASKTTASRVGKSRKDIRKEKKANIKGGMSRQEARLKKTQSKAASAKAKTNRTIKSIDPTKAKSADTGAKQTSAKSTRAKAKRLEKRAERLKGRVNASKVSK